MSKIFKTLFLFFLVFLSFSKIYANSGDLKIISRSQWGADESYRYIDSVEWKKILKRWEDTPKKELTEYQKKIAKIKAGKVKKANVFLSSKYSDIFGVDKIIKEENGHKLAWPIAYSKKKVAIVIHHTDTNLSQFKDDYEAIRNIYKYHAITRAWGDIGYNYLIGSDGDIFEGRAGGDFTVGAHDKWNNQPTIGISLIGNYSGKKASLKQMESLEKLTKYLVEKYNIDLSEKTPFFKWCLGTGDECVKKPLIINMQYPIIGHRDAGHTSCPGEKLYKQIQDMKKNLGVGKAKISPKNKILIKNIEIKLRKLNSDKLLFLLARIELLLDDSEKKSDKYIILSEIKKSIFRIIEDKNILNISNSNEESFDSNNKIKVKLSYPHSHLINFKLVGNFIPIITETNKQYLLEFKKKNSLIIEKEINLNFKLKNNKLLLKDKEILDFSDKSFFRLKVPENNIITISSWDRRPSWDKTGKFNDNKFKGDIVLYSKNNELVVVNDILLNDYLKGLGEVSNSTNPEKIKTIIVLARTYARWYMTKARKFAGEWFDASDDPNVFQKYVGFGLEQRSPKINKIVEETKDLIVTYNGDLIKPWYFSSSDGKTTSFIDYCENAKGVPDCAYPEKFPFLVGVTDNGGIGKKKAGHGVGVAGTGVQYFSERGWNFPMIIKYFLKGVEIEKKSN